MILFKACPRCGGDVDSTEPDDAHCIQCSHRLPTAFPRPRMIQEAAAVPDPPAPADDSSLAVDTSQDSIVNEPAAGPLGTDHLSCPRCESVELVRLDKVRTHDNICYRCRPCGHIFSPAEGREKLPRVETTG